MRSATAANRLALDTFMAVVDANGARDRRDRVEHAQVVAAEDFERFGKLNLVASMQPAHLLDDARWADARLGPAREKGAYAWLTMQRTGAHLAFGTDFPDYESIDPLQGIYACVTRQMIDDPHSATAVENRGSRKNACLSTNVCGLHRRLRLRRIEEQSKGVIRQGMAADIVVYPVNILQIPPPQLLKTPVVMTISGGKIRYVAPPPFPTDAPNSITAE